MKTIKVAVRESQKVGTLTIDLVSFVHGICRERCNPNWAEDIAQTVLMSLLLCLDKLDCSKAVDSYVGQAVERCFKYWMRKRRRERRYLIWKIDELLFDYPTAKRMKLKRAVFASGFAKLKYY